MILHLTPGPTPVEIHVHGEFGATERITVAPLAGTHALNAPAPARGRRWPMVAIPVAVVLAGFIGYRMGTPAPGEGVGRLAAYHSDAPRILQPSPTPARSLAEPILRTVPQADAAAATSVPAEGPAAVAQVLTQPPVVTPPAAMPIPAAAPRPAAQGGPNPFGLE